MKKATEIPEMARWTDEQIDAWLENHDVSELINKSQSTASPVIRTSTGMPRISKETLLAIFSRYSQERPDGNPSNWGDHLESVRKRLIDEDENIVRFMEFVVGKNFPRDLHNKAFECLIAVYAMIEHQVESNEIRRTLTPAGSRKVKV